MRNIYKICTILKDIEPIVYKHVRECDCKYTYLCRLGLHKQKFVNSKPNKHYFEKSDQNAK